MVIRPSRDPKKRGRREKPSRGHLKKTNKQKNPVTQSHQVEPWVPSLSPAGGVSLSVTVKSLDAQGRPWHLLRPGPASVL